ncbi:hypothetical protein M9434_007078 [Picochlorum sp. BPE23]|nr:hypothetical protein M9434_007078 [Picochlorum sp. BPE23]
MDIDYAVDSSVDPQVLQSRVSRILKLQDYADGFTGPAKVQRLLFLAEQCEGQDIALDALKAAHDYVTSHSIDLELYKTVIQRIRARAGDEYSENAEWIEQCDETYYSRQSDIEARLVSAKSALDQPTIATLEGEYGDLLFERGEHVDAMKHYMRMRDYSKSLDDFMSMTYRLVRCAFHSKNFFNVINHARKMESMTEAHHRDSLKVGQVRLMAALTQLILGKFDVAARALSKIRHEVISSSPDIISVESFGLCIALCSMASLGRRESENLMTSAPGFQEILDQSPQDVRDAILAFRAAHYGEALSLLEAVKPYAWVDYILSQHLSQLYSLIHDRCLCEYSSAFSNVSIAYMADTLNIKPSDLESRIVRLIQHGKLEATVDGQTNHIRIKQTSVKAHAFKSALEAAHTFLRDSKFIILRSGMLRHGLIKPGMPPTSFTPDLESQDPPGGEDHHHHHHQGGSSQIEAGDMSDVAT